VTGPMKDRHSDWQSEPLTGAEFEGAKWQRPVRRFRVVEDRGDHLMVESVRGPKRRRRLARKRLLSSFYRLKHLPPGPDGMVPAWPGSLMGGCLCCGPRPEVLALDSNPHPGFGGLTLYRDGEFVQAPDISRDEEVEAYCVQDHEDIAAGDPDHDWRIRIDAPMWDGVFQRHSEGRWVLIEKGIGFA
jgi:hypothetical protein